jgi:hypothetical protein
MVFVPREPFSAALPGLAPPRAVPSDLMVAAASRVLPADIVQKLVLLAIFVLACAGAAALLNRGPLPCCPLLARLAAGVFYAWNPYVAERLIIGQWALLLGYAGLPWVLRAVLAPDLASRRGAARLGLALLPAVIGGFAAMAITALVAVPAVLLSRSARRAAVALAALVTGSLPWFIPSLLHPVYVDPASVAAFAARADTPFGSVGSLLMLGGAWNAQTVPKAYGGGWSALWLGVVILALAGYLAFGRHRWPGLGVSARAANAATLAGSTYTGCRRDGMSHGRLPVTRAPRPTTTRRTLAASRTPGTTISAVTVIAANPPTTAGTRARASRAAPRHDVWPGASTARRTQGRPA